MGTHSHSELKRNEFECEYYDNGDKFIGGCMWQLQVEFKSNINNDSLRWSPQIVRCTGSMIEPKCPPFHKCVNKICNLCEEEGLKEEQKPRGLFLSKNRRML